MKSTFVEAMPAGLGFDAKVSDFLAQKRIAVVGVSRNPAKGGQRSEVTFELTSDF